MSVGIRALFLPSSCRMEVTSPARGRVRGLIQRWLMWSFQELPTALSAALGVFWVWMGRAGGSDEMGHMDLSLPIPRFFSSPSREENWLK